jgi:hypothetical protein
MWQQFLIQLAIVVGLKLLAKAQNQPEPSDLENLIINTDTKEGIMSVFLGPVLSQIAGQTLPAEVVPVIEGLTQAKSKEDIAAVVNNPKTKAGLFDGVANLLSSIIGGIFGGKN